VTIGGANGLDETPTDCLQSAAYELVIEGQPYRQQQKLRITCNAQLPEEPTENLELNG
jgi:hypothetical protein